jgi:hypothetical protein
MSTSRRRALTPVLAVIALAAMSALPSPALAAGKKPTTVIVSLKFPAFHGTLSSPRKACLGGRKVKMYRQANGKKKLLGRDTSEDSGKWKIPVGKNLKSGSYYAIVTANAKCKGDKSQILNID